MKIYCPTSPFGDAFIPYDGPFCIPRDTYMLETALFAHPAFS
jgi:hypothetical protein